MYTYIIYICWIESTWIPAKKVVFFLTKKRCNARWLGIYSNQHDHDFFSKHILGICGTSVKGSHPLEFIQHKKRQAWSFLFRCGMYSNQKRPYKDPIQHREDGHNIPFPRDEGSDTLLEVKCRPLPATRSGMAKNVPRKTPSLRTLGEVQEQQVTCMWELLRCSSKIQLLLRLVTP